MAWQVVRLGRPASDDGDMMAAALSIGAAPEILLRFADPLRPAAAATIAELAHLGLPARILSGDRPEPVAAVARALGVPGEGGLNPADKLAAIKSLAANGRRVLMVGTASTTARRWRPAMSRWRQVRRPMPARMPPMPFLRRCPVQGFTHDSGVSRFRGAFRQPMNGVTGGA